ncbi:hypothetical protein QFC19_003280 [Naganishia cerealis]|uniref:Uncharacterized protein n=1 Tax=Naganishia cerealis TaxID=610337 RepID=A0ACC2W4E1_9TREE|nr:hypothetical protein QFC19_003280 [Naganishia cerealis]
MPPKKNVDPDAPAAEPRRSGRVASQPTKPAPEPKAKPASKKAPASKKRAADGEPTANGDADKAPAAEKPASKKPKSTAEKPKSSAGKPKSAGADKPKSSKAASDEKPKSGTAAKPASKKAPTSSKKPASSAKPKSGKKTAEEANGDAIPEEDHQAAAEAEKEAEAAPEDKADTGDVKELQEGEVLPSITVQDNKGQDIDVSTLCDADNGLVIFVYPKANTPGCTTQACNYRDQYEEFTKLGYKVYGLSADTVSAQDKWATTKEFKYNLLADTKHDLLKQLGAFVPPKNIKRSHFIFEKGTGKLIEKKLGVKPADDTKTKLRYSAIILRVFVASCSIRRSEALYPTSMSNKNGKRVIGSDQDAEQGSAKKVKPHAFFSSFAARKEEAQLPPAQRSTVRVEAPPTVEHFLHLDPFAVLGADDAASPSSNKIKIAIYDLDGTLIQPKSGARFPKDARDWKWWDPNVKAKLAEVRDKQVLAATAKDEYRKPGIGLYELLLNLYESKGLEIDIENSFYVGDAAGRAGDHNDTDRKFAVNAGLTFYTPEQYFSIKDAGFQPFKGFDATAALEATKNLPLVTPANTPIIPASTKEIVLFVGYPASGKTSFYNKYFKPHGYVHVNQDSLKTRDKCLAMVRESMTFGANGCVVASYQLAKHNNFYRSWVMPNVPPKERRSILPETAFIGFKNALQEPDETEGFDEIRRVNFKFEGTQEERELWSRWMS